jgi:hypothetical protein
MSARSLMLAGFVTLCALAGTLMLASVPALAAGPEAPTVGEEAVSSLSATTATLSAQIGAGGSPTTYEVEYGRGTGGGYESSTPVLSLGAPEAPVGVTVPLTGLQPQNSYHYRFVATNALGTSQGTDATFATVLSLGASALILPDERAYELVSAGGGTGEVYVPIAGPDVPEDNTDTGRLFRAASDGNAVAYLADPSPSSGNGSVGGGGGNEWLSTRTQQGWSPSDIIPPASEYETAYQGFSDDLSVGILSSLNRPASYPSLLAGVQAECNVLYARRTGDGAYSALFTTTQTPRQCGEPVFAGGSTDSSHLLFQAAAALGPDMGPLPGAGSDNLYDSVNGVSRLVNVLPDGEVAPDATFGGPRTGSHPNEFKEKYDFSKVISADGSRIFWTDLSTGDVYMRSGGTATVPVSAGAAQFWTASSDGRYALYTEGGKLWRFDAEGAAGQEREELAGGEVQGVVGASEDSSYVYFVAKGALTSDARAQSCEKITEATNPAEEGERTEEEEGKLPPGKGCDLYVLHIGSSLRLIATLAPGDNTISAQGNETDYGDWRSDLGSRTAEVTADGRHLLFESRQRLTGYDNGGGVKDFFGNVSQRAIEIFVYEAETGRILCASCDPSGTPPVGESFAGNGSFLPISDSNTTMRRWISGDGSRVYFDAEHSLASQDANGVRDVYEWEREGAASCPEATPARLDGGCLFPISGGQSGQYSFFVDSSADGDDIFFTSRAQLVARDRDEKTDLYDARVRGGFPEVSLSCTGTGCQGLPPAPPIFATPSSVTFNGVGNFPPPSRPAAKPRSRPAKCSRKGFVKKHGRCVKSRPKKTSKRSNRGRK